MKRHLVVQRGTDWNCSRHRTGIRNMVAHVTEKEIRVFKALHKALFPKPFNDSAADSNADTAEAYSPPRISDAAARMGLKAGFALDLTEFDDDGKAWDLSDPQMQRRALEKLREEKPWLWVASSLCTPLSQVQHWNFSTTNLSKDKGVHCGWPQAPCICSGVVLGTGRSWEKLCS